MRRISTPLEKSQIESLKAGEEVLLSGTLYTARDQAHRRLVEAVRKGRRLPFALKGALVYYCGPARTPPGKTIGACGPTTSSRMDEFTPALLKAGLSGMIGKGRRSNQVISAIKRYRAVYFTTYAGCAALLAGCVKKAACLAYKELGPEAVYRLEVKDFPLFVAADAKGRDIYDKD